MNGLEAYLNKTGNSSCIFVLLLSSLLHIYLTAEGKKKELLFINDSLCRGSLGRKAWCFGLVIFMIQKKKKNSMVDSGMS
jgi:hypothetical protein